MVVSTLESVRVFLIEMEEKYQNELKEKKRKDREYVFKRLMACPEGQRQYQIFLKKKEEEHLKFIAEIEEEERLEEIERLKFLAKLKDEEQKKLNLFNNIMFKNRKRLEKKLEIFKINKKMKYNV